MAKTILIIAGRPAAPAIRRAAPRRYLRTGAGPEHPPPSLAHGSGRFDEAHIGFHNETAVSHGFNSRLKRLGRYRADKPHIVAKDAIDDVDGVCASERLDDDYGGRGKQGRKGYQDRGGKRPKDDDGAICRVGPDVDLHGRTLSTFACMSEKCSTERRIHAPEAGALQSAQTIDARIAALADRKSVV